MSEKPVTPPIVTEDPGKRSTNDIKSSKTPPAEVAPKKEKEVPKVIVKKETKIKEEKKVKKETDRKVVVRESIDKKPPKAEEKPPVEKPAEEVVSKIEEEEKVPVPVVAKKELNIPVKLLDSAIKVVSNPVTGGRLSPSLLKQDQSQAYLTWTF